MASVEELTQLLKSDCNGENLFDHLTETLLELLVHRPEDPMNSFDTISSKIRQSKTGPGASTSSSDVDVDEEHKESMLAYAHAVSDLLKKPDEPVEDTSSYTQIIDDAPLLKWCGVHFGEEETYRLFLSVRRLANSLNSPDLSLRFWGRIHTLSGFYYVLEGKHTLTEEEEAASGDVNAKEQEDDKGANRFSYWVATSTVSGWTKLPDVTRSQIVISRSIRRYLTGELTAPVRSYPPFPGQESHYLRTLLARIAASTSVSPSGFFSLNEDSETPSFEPADQEQLEARDSKSLDVLSSLDGWNHHVLEVNVKGRTLPPPEETDEEGNPVEENNPPDQVAPLRALSEDKENTWALRVLPGGAGRSPTSVVVLRSLVWPGAFAVANANKFVNVYVGDGMKRLDAKFSLSPPLPVNAEWCSNAEEVAEFAAAQLLSQDGGEEEVKEGEEQPTIVYPKLLVESADIIHDPTPPEEESED